jgi:transposase, IS30 family
MNYTHLSQNERYQIYSMLELLPVADIAKRLDRHESTIRRELVRNRGGRGYRPKQAQVLADVRSLGSRNAVCITPQLWGRVDELLRAQHSPEQIAGCVNISHETVYQHVYADATGELKSNLRCQAKRSARSATLVAQAGVVKSPTGAA